MTDGTDNGTPDRLELKALAAAPRRGPIRCSTRRVRRAETPYQKPGEPMPIPAPPRPDD